MTTIITNALPDGTFELKITGTQDEIRGLLFPEPEIDVAGFEKFVSNALDAVKPEGGINLPKLPKLPKLPRLPNLQDLPGKLIDPIGLGNALFPMKDYCVTFTTMEGPEDAAGKLNVQRETIHVRGGLKVAKTRAAIDHGDANVRSVDQGACR